METAEVADVLAYGERAADALNSAAGNSRCTADQHFGALLSKALRSASVRRT